MYSKYLHIVINMEHFLYKYLGACCVATESFDSPSTGNRFEKNQCTFEAKRDHTRAVRTVWRNNYLRSPPLLSLWVRGLIFINMSRNLTNFFSGKILVNRSAGLLCVST